MKILFRQFLPIYGHSPGAISHLWRIVRTPPLRDRPALPETVENQ